LRFRDKIISLQELILWTIFWFIVAFLVFFPEVTSYAANWVGVGRGVDLVIYMAILILFYLMFRALSKLDKVEKDVTRVVRTVALKDEVRAAERLPATRESPKSED
jgi:small membrane protein